MAQVVPLEGWGGSKAHPESTLPSEPPLPLSTPQRESSSKLISPLLQDSIFSVGRLLASVSSIEDAGGKQGEGVPPPPPKKHSIFTRNKHVIFMVTLFLATTLSWGVCVFLFSLEKKIDKDHPLSIGSIQLHVGLGALICFMMAFSVFFKDMHKLKHFGLKRVHSLGFLAGVCNNLGNQGFSLMVLSGGGSTVLGPLSGLNLVVTVTLGIIFLKEPLTLRKVFGSFVVMGALFLLSYNFESKTSGDFNIWEHPKVIGYFLLSFFGWGTGKFLLAVMGPSSVERRGTVLCVSTSGFVFAALFITGVIHREATALTTLGHGIILISGFLGAFGNMMFTIFVGSDGQASILAPLTSLNVVWPVILGAVFLHERVRDAQIGGILLALLGIFILCAKDWDGMVHLLCPSLAKYLILKKKRKASQAPLPSKEELPNIFVDGDSGHDDTFSESCVDEARQCIIPGESNQDFAPVPLPHLPPRPNKVS